MVLAWFSAVRNFPRAVPVKITHYLYNAFLVEQGPAKIAIDPGQNLWLFDLHSLIPQSEWPSVTHIAITHGDPDHHWHSDRVAAASGAHVVCGNELTKEIDGQRLVVDPRGRGLTSWVHFNNLNTMDVGDKITLDEVSFEAVRSVHGPIAIPLPFFTLRQEPGPNERVGLGSMGFKITIGGKSVLNLGDSLFLPEWEGLAPDVLMLPIGGMGQDTWTMDVDDAVRAVELIAPQAVIPCHYSVPFFWKRKFAIADDERFKQKVEELGVECHILKSAGELVVQDS
jgi:L-ascorbate metabolism protein UlaG (beta-lactamase superfamily)